ncbi:hypothetical protein H8B06_18000 [Sphingobacterium sp. DN00404]|uniref:O-antigen ligase-related domain-containing protein n=1 Tax=Sphingobacterium micropteri TaxID=2763501 RepID=A0ABR7YTQ9_9SPHI|nr:O-antigen ligase family protein [Sphingobacterium micropteri]MBD1434724.1 hypothetical protein [Sphingobacterium micropteri]
MERIKPIIYLIIGVGIPVLAYLLVGYHHVPIDGSLFTGILFATILGIIVLFVRWGNRFYISWFDYIVGVIFVYLASRGLFGGTYLSSLFWVSLLLLFVSIRALNPVIHIRLFFYTGLMGLCLLALQGYLQYFGVLPSNNTFFDITGPFHNPALFGGFMSILFVSIVAFFFLDRHNRGRKGALMACLSCFPLIITIDSRAALLALIASTGYILFRGSSWCVKKKEKSKRLMLITLILILVPILSWQYFKRTESVQGRMLIWKVSWDMIKEKPVWGWGSNGFSANYMHYQAMYLQNWGIASEKRLAGNNYLVFNEPIRIAVAYGAVGLCFYLGGIYYLLFRFRPRQKLGITLKVAILAYIVQGLFAYPTANYAILLWMAILFALAVRELARKNHCIKLSIQRKGLGRVFLLIAICFITIGIFDQWRSHRLFVQVWQNRRHYSADQHLGFLQSLQTPLQQNARYLAYYAQTLFKNNQYAECIAVLQKWVNIKPVNEAYILWGDCLYALSSFHKAEQMYIYANAMVPSRQRTRVRLAILYKNMGKWEEGRSLARQVLEEDVKIYSFETYELHQQLRDAFNIY